MSRNTASLVVAIIAATSLACAGSPDVQIGAILSLAGQGSPYGQSIRNGVELAADEINAEGGISVLNGDAKPLTLLVRDAQSNPQTAVQHARELIELGVPAVIGGDVSNVTLALAPLFEEAERILLSPSTSTPRLTTAGIYIYRNFPSDELEAVNVANYIFNQLGLQEAAVVASQSEFGLGQKTAFIQRLRALGGREVTQESYPEDATEEDYSRVARSVVSSGAPVVYIAGYSDDTAAVARAIRAAGGNAPLVGTGAVLVNDLVEAGGTAVDGLVFPYPSFDVVSQEPHIRRFVAAYRERYGYDPDTYAAHGYDAVKVLALAVQEAGTSPAELRFYLNSMNPYEGVTGATDFDDNGDVRKFHRMFRVEGGVAVPLGDD